MPNKNKKTLKPVVSKAYTAAETRRMKAKPTVKDTVKSAKTAASKALKNKQATAAIKKLGSKEVTSISAADFQKAAKQEATKQTLARYTNMKKANPAAKSKKK